MSAALLKSELSDIRFKICYQHIWFLNQSYKCWCVLPLWWGQWPVCREHGTLCHQAFELWKTSRAHCSLCSAPRVHVRAGLELKRCWASGILGRIACATWQWICPSVPALWGLPLQSIGFLACSVPAQAFGVGKPNAGCSVSHRWLYEGGDIKGLLQPVRFWDKKLF